MTIEVLAGGRGDCLWIECARNGSRPWRLLFDGGMPNAWPALRQRIEAMPAGDRTIDLAVVSHIDADHIGGMLPLFSDQSLGLVFGDIWFNGLEHLPVPSRSGAGGASRSVAQGASLSRKLGGTGAGPKLPWNETFNRGPVTTGEHTGLVPITETDWPTITLLSPTEKKLASMQRLWTREIARVRRGEPAEPAVPPEPLVSLDDFDELAETKTNNDSSVPNGSSVAFLLEHRGASCLLTGDAHVNVLGAALTRLAAERGKTAIDVDVYKISHHGSKGNVTPKLLALSPAENYILSTNGDRFDHPDDVGVARIVQSAPPGAKLWFNYRTDKNVRWADADLQATHGFSAGYPDDGAEGVGIEIDAAARGRT
jgi:hypothetical protein